MTTACFSEEDYFLACSGFIIYSLIHLPTTPIKQLQVSIKTIRCIHNKMHFSTYFYWKAFIFAANCLLPFMPADSVQGKKYLRSLDRCVPLQQYG